METTVKNMLLTALLPIGKTMYIYGGGWNEENTGSCPETVSFGVSPLWEEFYKKQESGYNHKNFDVRKTPGLIHCGLDCSAYVGWLMYNLFGNTYSNRGYVDKAERLAGNLRDMGIGSYSDKHSISDYLPCDIMGGEGYPHIWVCIGGMSDGSLVLVHSSPPAPMISGTETPEGSRSLAIELAEGYMGKYFKAHFRKYPNVTRERAYLTDFGRFRFYPEILKDPDGYRNMPTETLMENLFETFAAIC